MRKLSFMKNAIAERAEMRSQKNEYFSLIVVDEKCDRTKWSERKGVNHRVI
ncbi:MAG: hypothetical protein KAF91_31140 [Nostoc sp. TH1S01]|nr:hypothetical protein [Nostoc sp. TH1S01]